MKPSENDSTVTPMDALLSSLARALEARTFVKLTLGKSVAAELKQAFIRVVEIKKTPHLSILYRYQTKDITENHPLAEAVGVLRHQLETRFANAHLFTTEADIELLTNKRGEARILEHKPTFGSPAPTEHNRVKRYVLDPASAPYLRELGIVTADSKVRSDKADKYRQLQNIIKILDEHAGRSALAGKARLRVVDMGCGKGYLTFALYDYCNNHLGIDTEVIGIDKNEALMTLCNGIAGKLGYARLKFLPSTVEACEIGQADIVIALHACDIATDTALFKGIAAGASVLMVVPCCQKELRPQLKVPASERPILKHDTFKDRYSQMLTDALRGLLLESQGYRTRIMEFISDAHTHRNVMLLGVHDEHYRVTEQKQRDVEEIEQRYRITKQELQRLLIESGRLPAGDLRGCS